MLLGGKILLTNNIMINNPKISVLMPAYNTEKYISEAIESILNQTFKDFEFIIIDDGSTDRTWDIIQEYEKKDDRIVALRNVKNLGIPTNRNKLVSMAKGKYIVWQDSDDISLPYRIEKQYNFMEKNPEIGICGGWLQIFNENNKLSIRKYASDDKNLRKNIFKYSPIAQPVSIIRKEILDKTNGYDKSLKQAEDLDMSFKIGTFSEFSNLQEVLLKYRFDNNSISKNKMKENIIYTLKVRKKAVKKYNYKMNVQDRSAFVITFLIKFLPKNYIFFIFNRLRNS